ncbi:MAG: alpha/beta hydrolase, partial [Oligoflexia bacterium]|nr:alpha/beta hydrolase [Oligoflexia bacterium]
LARFSGLVSSMISNYRNNDIASLLRQGWKNYIIEDSAGGRTNMLVALPSNTNLLEKRPLVVFVGGFSADLEMSAFNAIAVPLHRFYGWNVALVESVTSASWINKNKKLIISGREAGRDLYLKLAALRHHPEIGPWISEMALVGLSLGGSDCAFASLFTEDYPELGVVIDGPVISISSPADRLGSLGDIRQKGGPAGLAIKRMFSSAYFGAKGVFDSYVDRDFCWLCKGASIDQLLEELFLQAERSTASSTVPHNGSDIPSEYSSLENYKTLFDLNKYINKIKIPLLWINSIDDPIVDYSLTFPVVKRLSKNPLVGLMTLKEGGHVGYAYSYGQGQIDRWIIETVVAWGKRPEAEYYKWRRIGHSRVNRFTGTESIDLLPVE